MNNVITINGHALSYTDKGNGQTVVLLHGYLESKEIWNDLSNYLSASNRVICPDLPGHGESEFGAEAATMEILATSVKQLLDQLNIATCVLLGHSMGGYVALAFADLFPQHLSGFGLVHSHPFADSNEKRASRMNDIEAIERGEKSTIVESNIPKLFANDNLIRLAAQVEKWKQIAIRTPDKGVVASLKGMSARVDRSYVLDKLSVPGIFIFGKKDNLIPNEIGLKAEHAYSHFRTIWLEKSGHLGFVEEPDQMRFAIASFLKEMTSRA